jgi:hypothetical protein
LIRLSTEPALAGLPNPASSARPVDHGGSLGNGGVNAGSGGASPGDLAQLDGLSALGVGKHAGALRRVSRMLGHGAPSGARAAKMQNAPAANIAEGLTKSECRGGHFLAPGAIRPNFKDLFRA